MGGCICTKNATGRFCDQEAPGPCKNGGVYNALRSSCEGCEGGWTGADCGTCAYTQSYCAQLSDSNLSPEKCQCENKFMKPVEPPCTLTCHNGGQLDSSACKCISCNGMWTGASCDQCNRESCPKGSTLDKAACKCTGCQRPWAGVKCNYCPYSSGGTPCPNGGTIDEENCLCVNCDAGFTGPTCEDAVSCETPFFACKNGGLWDPKTCKCDCAGTGFSGKACDVCKLATSSTPGTVCKHGGMFAPSQCSCLHCSWPWTGRQCNKCNTEAGKNCMNGASFNATQCKCQCPYPYTGEQCSQCALSNEACAAANASKPHAVTTKGRCQCGCIKTRACGKGETWMPESCMCKALTLDEALQLTHLAHMTKLEIAIEACIAKPKQCSTSLLSNAYVVLFSNTGKCLKLPSECTAWGPRYQLNVTSCDCEKVQPHPSEPASCNCPSDTPCLFAYPDHHDCRPLNASGKCDAGLTNCKESTRVFCPSTANGECNGKGNCSQGACKCKRGWQGSSCTSRTKGTSKKARCLKYRCVQENKPCLNIDPFSNEPCKEQNAGQCSDKRWPDDCSKMKNVTVVESDTKVQGGH